MSKSQKRDLQSYALLGIPLALLFFNPEFLDPFNISKLLALCILSSAILLTLIFTFKKSEVTKDPRKFIYRDATLFASFAIAMVVAGLISTPNLWRFSLGMAGRNNGVLYYLVVIFLCLIIFFYGHAKSNQKRVTRGLDYSGYLLIFYSVIQLLGIDPFKWQGSQNPIIGTFGNTNFSAAALGAFGTYFLVKSTAEGKILRPNQVWNGLISIVAVFLSWKTDSIQGPLLFIALTGLYFSLNFKKSRGKSWYGITPLLLLFIVGVFAFLTFVGLGPLGDKFEQYTLKLRFTYAQIGLKIMFDNPFFGIGSDSYLNGFRELRSSAFVSTYGLNVITNNAHSVPIQIGANFGILCFVLYILIMLKVVIAGIRILSQNSERKGDLDSIVIFWLALFFQSLLSIEQVGLGAPTWILGAYILKYARRDEIVESTKAKRIKDKPNFQVNYAELFILFALLFGLLFSIPLSREDSAKRNLIALEINSRPAEANDVNFVKENYEQLSSMTKDDPIQMGPILEKLFAINEIKEIEKISVRGIEKNPNDYYAWENLAAYFEIISNKPRRLDAYNKMLELDPLNYVLMWKTIELHRELGDVNSALSLAQRILQIAPNSEQGKLAQNLISTGK